MENNFLEKVKLDPNIAAEIVRCFIADEDFNYVKKEKKEDTKKITEFTGCQKAAIFFIAAGEDLTAEIFKFMREDEIETAIFEISRIDSVSRKVQDDILEEFSTIHESNLLIGIGGIDYAKNVLEKSFGTQKAIDVINRLTSSLQCRPFDFIRRCNPALLLSFIQQEHPQTVAVILSYLEPNKSSVILQHLQPDLQSEVTRRISTMDRVSPEILREVERVLEKKLSSMSAEEYTVAGGIETMVEILNLIDRASEKQIIEALEDEDPELAEEIKKRMFVFEDLIMMDDRAIQKIMREVDSQELAKALINVDVEVQDKIFRNMSKRAAGMLKEDMVYMGPVQLKDIEEAQQKIVSITRHLEDIGEIVIRRCGDNELICYEDDTVEPRKSKIDFSDYICGLDMEDVDIKNILNTVQDDVIIYATKITQKNIRKYIYKNLDFIRMWKIKIKKLFLKYRYLEDLINAQMELTETISSFNKENKEENDE